MSQTRRDSSPSHVLPDTCLDDTPHTFLGAVNNDKNCLLSHSFPTKALSQSFTHSLLLTHSLVELCVRSMSFRLCPPLLHIVAPFSFARSLSFSLLLHISAVACIDFVYRERRTTPPPPLPLFIQWLKCSQPWSEVILFCFPSPPSTLLSATAALFLFFIVWRAFAALVRFKGGLILNNFGGEKI